MSKTRFVSVPMTFLIIIGLLVAGGWAIHRIGWSEGYRMGQMATTGEVGAAVPYAPYGLSYIGLFLMVGLIALVLMGLIGKLFRLWAWKTVAGPWMMAGGPWKMAGVPRNAHWARHGRPHHHHMHPWCWGWEEPSEETAGPDAETSSAESAR
jgi:hypothetical protein